MHEEALLHFKALPATTPADAASKQIAVAQTFEDLGKRREALEAYHHALALKPGWAVALAGILPLQQADTGADMSEPAIRLLEQKSLPPPGGGTAQLRAWQDVRHEGTPCPCHGVLA